MRYHVLYFKRLRNCDVRCAAFFLVGTEGCLEAIATSS